MTARAVLTDRGKLQADAPLSGLTTYKLGGPARFLVEVDDEEDLHLASRLASEEGLEIMALGRGSNVVVSDRGFPGVVVRAGPGLSRWRLDGVAEVVAGAGMPLPILARESARAGRGGLEFFTGIPGSVGGAVRMNAGCHGSETADWLVKATICGLGTGEITERSVADLDMSYRHSNLTDDDYVLSARFHTVERDPKEAEAAIREITRWRREHQPGGTLNAGSVFKNPPGDSAGRVIDEAGLKGLRVGGAEVSERHANFFVAGEEATATDLYRLVDQVRQEVHRRTGVVLEPEIRFIGSFEP